jgi:glycosyltransferase involved in cell wall biosynthesis
VKPAVDVLQVALGTTLGQARSDERLRADLEAEGLSVAVAEGRYDRLDRWPRPPFLDLYQAAEGRAAVHRALRRWSPRAIVHASPVTAYYEPRARLARSVVRFDNPAALSRPGARNAGPRALERRVLRHARVLSPYSPRPTAKLLRAAPAGARVIPFGFPIDLPDAAADADREPVVLAYAGNPHKKGLDVIARAWASTARAGRTLVVTGVEREAALAFLAERGVPAPPDTEWPGRVPPAAFAALCAGAEVYVGASRREEYGAAQLQALAGGCLLVHADGEFPVQCDAYELARELDPALTAPPVDAGGLAAALDRALHYGTGERAAYAARARDLLAAYTPAAFTATVRERLVPALREPA